MLIGALLDLFLVAAVIWIIYRFFLADLFVKEKPESLSELEEKTREKARELAELKAKKMSF